MKRDPVLQFHSMCTYPTDSRPARSLVHCLPRAPRALSVAARPLLSLRPPLPGSGSAIPENSLRKHSGNLDKEDGRKASRG
ncbi:hypothetical protein NDU88_004307 [Pleurodeles waltl]|uniref:Uncharacterized protein n=1 Tax=Pleurodeles waltl TaxID=8319 RepID=A0AAV7L1K5_PLEWA|nr:hypothetical protein NDU88_004307 [Pleurodeles waltl]